MDKDFVEKFKALIEAKMGDSNLNVEDLGKVAHDSEDRAQRQPHPLEVLRDY